MEGLVYIGKVVSVEPLDCSTVQVTADCGTRGTYKGTVKVGSIPLNQQCVVYLSKEIVITKVPRWLYPMCWNGIGDDVTDLAMKHA
jgi:hypothetical protein